MSSLRRYAPALTLILGLASLYVYQLSGVGVLDPDEPRYLAIGRAMSASGDYVTPRLWGTPWFEKPPLLYWLTALGTKAHLGIELSGRLPIALLSLLFLCAMFWLLRTEYGNEIAGIAVALLGSSALWFAYSSFALTDLPLAVFYSLAVLLALPLLAPADSAQKRSARFVLIGVLLGLATLAKGLVPIALAVPFLWFLRHRWRQWWIALVALLATALPWYLAVTARNGRTFLDDFFWKHHFERFYSPALQHVQPWWYYVPVLVGALLPWSPLLAAIRVRRAGDRRQRFLLACIAFGFVLFSISLNKLPGYLLPLLPLTFTLIAASVDWRSRRLRVWLLPCAFVIACVPLLAQILPEMLAAGRISVPAWPRFHAREVFYIAVPFAALLFARRSWLLPLLVLCFVASSFYVKILAYPALDRTVSARAAWHNIEHVSGSICDNWAARKWAYGLALYRGAPYPMCGTPGLEYDYKLESSGKDMPFLIPTRKSGK